MKKIGLIGGGGAFASQHILKLILEQSINLNKINTDEQFPDILLHNIPFKGFDKEAHLNNTILEQIKNSIKIFEYAHCDIIAICCNTLHFFLPTLTGEFHTPMYNLLEICAKKLSNKQFKNVGILCSHTSLDMKIHEPFLNQVGINAIYPNIEQQIMIDIIIGKIITNTHSELDKSIIHDIILSLFQKGCDGCLLGCTELSLLNIQNEFIIDSSLVLAIELSKLSQKENYACI